MSQYNHQQPPPVSYPAPPKQQGPFVAPPPLGYPMKNAGQPDQPPPFASETKHRGFGKGCCAGLCCCCLLDACF